MERILPCFISIKGLAVLVSEGAGREWGALKVGAMNANSTKISLMLGRCRYEEISATRGYSLPQAHAGSSYLRAHPCTLIRVLVQNLLALSPQPVNQEGGYTDSGGNVIRSALHPYSQEPCQGREFSN